MNATYGFSPRFRLSLTLPFVHNTRSSLYEHDRTNRYETSAGGLADLQLVGHAWLSRPESHTNGDLALGRFSFNVSAPVAGYRNRLQSMTDKEMGRHGDAAFVDWFSLAGVSRRF